MRENLIRKKRVKRLVLSALLTLALMFALPFGAAGAFAGADDGVAPQATAVGSTFSAITIEGVAVIYKVLTAASVGGGNGGGSGGGNGNGTTAKPDDKVTAGKTVLPKTKIKKVSPGKKRVNLTFVKVDKKLKVTRYQIQYRVKGLKKWKLKNVKVKYTGASTANVTIKKLKANKRYQFRVRAMQAVGQANNYAKWSPTKTSGKIKK